MTSRILLSFAAVATLSGCVTLNPVTMLQLATLDVMTADPTQMALPDNVEVADGSAFIQLEAQFNGDSFDERFVLTQRADDIWAIASGDRERFRVTQDRAVAWERADAEESSGSFSIGFQPCAVADGPQPDARVSLHVQLEPAARFLPLFTNVPVSDFYEEEDIEALRRCDDIASAD